MRTRRLLLSLLFSLGVTLLTAVALTTKPLPIAHAADLTVDTTLDNESNGCDTDNCTLREAITDANSGDTIIFDLTYPATITLTSGQITIDKDLTIDGPGADQLAISGNDASRVFYISGGKVTIDDLKVTQGMAPIFGGGIHIVNSNTVVTLTRINVVGNSASTGAGGGVFLRTGSLLIEGGQILSNTADTDGGISLESGEATLNEGEIRGNTAEYAGGVYVGSDLGTATFTMTGISIIGYNTAHSSGGGLYVDNGIAVLSSGQVISNTAQGTDVDNGGGGLYISGVASVTVCGGHHQQHRQIRWRAVSRFRRSDANLWRDSQQHCRQRRWNIPRIRRGNVEWRANHQ